MCHGSSCYGSSSSAWLAWLAVEIVEWLRCLMALPSSSFLLCPLSCDPSILSSLPRKARRLELGLELLRASNGEVWGGPCVLIPEALRLIRSPEGRQWIIVLCGRNLFSVQCVLSISTFDLSSIIGMTAQFIKHDVKQCSICEALKYI